MMPGQDKAISNTELRHSSPRDRQAYIQLSLANLSSHAEKKNKNKKTAYLQIILKLQMNQVG